MTKKRRTFYTNENWVSSKAINNNYKYKFAQQWSIKYIKQLKELKGNFTTIPQMSYKN